MNRPAGVKNNRPRRSRLSLLEEAWLLWEDETTLSLVSVDLLLLLLFEEGEEEVGLSVNGSSWTLVDAIGDRGEDGLGMRVRRLVRARTLRYKAIKKPQQQERVIIHPKVNTTTTKEILTRARRSRIATLMINTCTQLAHRQIPHITPHLLLHLLREHPLQPHARAPV